MQRPATIPKPTQRTPLLTPSTSPPASGLKFIKQFAPSDSAPPAKRSRVSSLPTRPTTSTPIPRSLPSAAKLPQSDDYAKEREAARLRLINVWSSLAERYSKPFDEDDIVDIITGEVVKDRGVISGWDSSQQGSFSNIGRKRKHGKEQPNEEEEEAEEGEGEAEGGDDVDELDAFATGEPANVGLKSRESGEDAETALGVAPEEHTPPVENSQHAEVLLKEFMEDEKKRRVVCGNESDSSSDDLEIYQTQLRRFRSARLLDVEDSTTKSPELDDDFPSSEGFLSDSRPPTVPPSSSPVPSDEFDDELYSDNFAPILPPSSSPVPQEDSDSDDELGRWDIQEERQASSATMPQTGERKNDDDDDSEVEIIEHRTIYPLLRSPPTSRTSPIRTRARTRAKTVAPSNMTDGHTGHTSSPAGISTFDVFDRTPSISAKKGGRAMTPSPTPKRVLKRKRVVSSSGSEASVGLPDRGTPSPPILRTSRPPRRRQSSLPPFPLEALPHPPHPPLIFPDSRVQAIVAQAIQQLSELVGLSFEPSQLRQSVPPPYTPTHHRHDDIRTRSAKEKEREVKTPGPPNRRSVGPGNEVERREGSA
ncbi:hypothetical protein AX17_005299 [Amanita inopinata Kibby_2008]|nr:hypothetical protein AX17_005299 [Amanita inopinata Kibby_2008]